MAMETATANGHEPTALAAAVPEHDDSAPVAANGYEAYVREAEQRRDAVLAGLQQLLAAEATVRDELEQTLHESRAQRRTCCARSRR